MLSKHPSLWSFTGLSVMPDGVAAFRAFLKTEFSEENLEFWLACEEFKKTRSTAKLVSKAHRIFEEFVDVQAPREVNIDFQTREATRKNMQEPSLTCFDQAQGKVHSLMEKDSYPRFLRSKMYLDLLSQSQRRLMAKKDLSFVMTTGPPKPPHPAFLLQVLCYKLEGTPATDALTSPPET
ncbi:regulator of G-protein signaling 8-like protein [Cricetulus griseus]|nr:regulator of G-protein signaling 8-like protein [Cricetulus griseus]